MKYRIFATLAALMITSFAHSQVLLDNMEEEERTALTIDKGLSFCEGTTIDKNQILVSNFGSTTLDPLNQEGRGYIVSVNPEGKMKTIIPATGHLSAPRGMIVSGGHLFIAEVGRVVVYDLSETGHKPQTIMFPEEDLFVNDVVKIADMVIVSVTNTGRIYAINAKNPSNVDGQKPQLIGNVPGANGMAVNGSTLYIASYNPNGASTADNVIYAYDIFATKGSMRKLIPNLKPGQYDGIAVSEDGSHLYFTSWGNGTEGSKPEIFAYELDGKNRLRTLDFGVEFQGPADITYKDGYIWIPDLPRSILYRFPLPK